MIAPICAALRRAALLAVLGAGLPFLPAAAQQSAEGGGEFAANVRSFKRPHLTVVISIDQFRADYLRRLTDLFLPPRRRDGNIGGFRYLMEEGSYFVDARYGHVPLYTGPGHAVILTGGYPYKTGIVSNDWWDPVSGQPVYCVDDPRWKVVGARSGSVAKPMGPLNLRSTTVGDELKLASGGASRVVSLALKDRAAILLGGHAQDVCIWYDDQSGRWISSTAYCKEGRLPDWVEALNAEGIPDRALGSVWNPIVSPEGLRRAIMPVLPPEREPYGMGRTFPHRVGTEKTRNSYRGFTFTPAANTFVFETAQRAILAERLGQRGETPDLLALNLSTNDYVGHAFGPYSPEALDITVQTDRALSVFLNFLRVTIPGGLKEVVVVVTADHGVVPIVESLQAMGVSAGRVLESAINTAAQTALNRAFGGTWVGKSPEGRSLGGYVEPYFYLNPAALSQALAEGKAKSASEIEAAAARAIAAIPGIYACHTRTQVLEGRLPATEIGRRVANGFHPRVSGDVLVVTEPMHFTDPGTPGPYVTTHGSPYAYDTHVPILIAGPGIRSGIWADPVSPADIAPTLCALLGIELPAACDGRILRSALK